MRFFDSFVSIFFILDNKLIKMTFVEIKPGCHFTLDNLPYGVFSTSHNVSVIDVFEKIWGESCGTVGVSVSSIPLVSCINPLARTDTGETSSVESQLEKLHLTE